MKKLFWWFEDEASGWKLVRFVLMILVADLLLSYIIGFSMRALDIPITAARAGKTPIVISPLSWSVVSWLVWIVLWEEIRFRLPLAIPTSLLKWGPSAIIGSAVVLSLLFSYIHDGGNRVTQVTGALLYCGMYLKAGGWKGKILKPLAVVTFAHLAFNAFNIMVILLTGGKTI